MARSVLTRRRLPEAGRDPLGGLVVRLESRLLRGLWTLAGWLPPGLASALGARVLGVLGPRLPKHRHVCANLAHLRACRPPPMRAKVACATWRNLGAVFAEYPHLGRLSGAHLELEVPDPVRAIVEAKAPAVYVTAHLANWELAAAALARVDVRPTVVYTALGDRELDARLNRFRESLSCDFVEKSVGARGLMRALETGQSLGFVADQRVDTGVALSLFGASAWTTTTPARLALRFGVPLVPLVVERRPGARFLVRFEPPIARPEEADAAGAAAMTADFLRRVEAWIEAHPDQWMCTKRRWPKQTDGGLG